jgi:hypothetical protein
VAKLETDFGTGTKDLKVLTCLTALTAVSTTPHQPIIESRHVFATGKIVAKIHI